MYGFGGIMAVFALGALCVPALPATAPDEDVAEFCQNVVDAHAALANARSDIIESALEAARAAVPDEIRVATAEALDALLAHDDEASSEPYAELMGYIQDHCGYETLAVAASEYAFGGLPETLPAGIYVIEMANIGEEFHSMHIGRFKDGVTETLEDMLGMTPAQGSQLTIDLGDMVVAPGEVGYQLIDLQPGRHILLCFLPVGATPEHMPEIEAGAIEGPRHHSQGMSAEIIVE